MFKKVWLLLATALLATLVLSGCGDKKEKEKPNNNEELNVPENELEEEDNEPKENVNNEEENEVNEEINDEEDKENKETVDRSEEFAELITYMEEETEGTAQVIYENDEAQVYDLGDMSVSVDAYTLVELKDFHSNFTIPFNDQTDGGVIIVKYSVKNELDKDAYYAPQFYMGYTGASKSFGPAHHLIPDDVLISTKLSHNDNYLIKAGDTVSGYYIYTFGKDHFEEALAVSTVAVEIPSGQAKEESYDQPIGKAGKLTLSLNEEGEKKQEGNKAFYNDKVTLEDMGIKEMIKEKQDINESQDLRDVKVTLEGYQFTEFTPNEIEAPRFSNFTEGVVLLTVKFDLDNQGSETIGLSSMLAKLNANDGAQRMLAENMLLDYNNHDFVEAGSSSEWLQIFVLDKEQYDKIWKDKAFEVEVGPMLNEDAKDISKGSTIIFTLPH